MKLVTAIVPEKKGRKLVYLDGEPAFMLYRAELAGLPLKEGEELDDMLLSHIYTEVLIPRAVKRLLYLLGSRDYSMHELDEKLKAGYYPATVRELALERLSAYGIVGDEDYTRRYVECYMGRRSEGEIRRKLLSKGISRAVLDAAFENYHAEHMDSAGAERELIRQVLARRHYEPSAAGPREKQREYAYLARHGFKSSDISAVLRGA